MLSRQLRKLTSKIGAKAGPIPGKKSTSQQSPPSATNFSPKLTSSAASATTSSTHSSATTSNGSNPPTKWKWTSWTTGSPPAGASGASSASGPCKPRASTCRWTGRKRKSKNTFTRIDPATYTTVVFMTLANTEKALRLMPRLEPLAENAPGGQKHRPGPAESATSEILRNDPKAAESPQPETHKSVPIEKLRNDPNSAHPTTKRDIIEPREPTPKT